MSNLKTLHAHYDGERIVLDEPFDLPENARLLVTLISEEGGERVSWTSLAAENLARAYGEAEPDYTVADLRPLR